MNVTYNLGITNTMLYQLIHRNTQLVQIKLMDPLTSQSVFLPIAAAFLRSMVAWAPKMHNSITNPSNVILWCSLSPHDQLDNQRQTDSQWEKLSSYQHTYTRKQADTHALRLETPPSNPSLRGLCGSFLRVAIPVPKFGVGKTNTPWSVYVFV